MRKLKILLFIVLSFLSLAAVSAAATRTALVIGNGAYKSAPLKNPVNDAKDIAKALKSVGFEVDLKLNATQESMENAIQNFGKRLGNNAVGLFYYAGHGVQYKGNNYLIPIGAMDRVTAPDHLRYKTVDAGYVLGAMKDTGNMLNIVILDACRNNPFRSFSRSMNAGLKRIQGAEGTIIAYSTSPGKVALDGSGRNSPYTKELIKLIKKPNLPIEIMLKQVRRGVKSETKGEQSPWYESSIDGDFCFFRNFNIGNDISPIIQHTDLVEKLIGEWEGTDYKGAAASLVFHKDKRVKFVQGNNVLDGSSVGGYATWEIDATKNPNHLDLVLSLSGEIKTLPMIIRFITDKKIQLRCGKNLSIRPAEFTNSDDINQIFFVKQ